MKPVVLVMLAVVAFVLSFSRCEKTAVADEAPPGNVSFGRCYMLETTTGANNLRLGGALSQPTAEDSLATAQARLFQGLKACEARVARLQRVEARPRIRAVSSLEAMYVQKPEE